MSESTAIEEAFNATLESVVEKCREIIKEKRPVYQDVWWEIPSRTIDHLVAFRARRITKIRRKYTDKLIKEHVDLIVYAVMALTQLKEELKHIK